MCIKQKNLKAIEIFQLCFLRHWFKLINHVYKFMSFNLCIRYCMPMCWSVKTYYLLFCMKFAAGVFITFLVFSACIERLFLLRVYYKKPCKPGTFVPYLEQNEQNFWQIWNNNLTKKRNLGFVSNFVKGSQEIRINHM